MLFQDSGEWPALLASVSISSYLLPDTEDAQGSEQLFYQNCGYAFSATYLCK